MTASSELSVHFALPGGCGTLEELMELVKGPDFPTGGLMDAGNYNEGERGGKIRLRSNIEVKDRKLLVVKDIPYTTTTVIGILFTQVF